MNRLSDVTPEKKTIFYSGLHYQLATKRIIDYKNDVPAEDIDMKTKDLKEKTI